MRICRNACRRWLVYANRCCDDNNCCGAVLIEAGLAIALFFIFLQGLTVYARGIQDYNVMLSISRLAARMAVSSENGNGEQLFRLVHCTAEREFERLGLNPQDFEVVIGTLSLGDTTNFDFDLDQKVVAEDPLALAITVRIARSDPGILAFNPVASSIMRIEYSQEYITAEGRTLAEPETLDCVGIEQ